MMDGLGQILARHGVDTITFRRVPLSSETSIAALIVPARAAMTTWTALRDLVAETTHWPILLGEAAWAREFLPVLFDGAAEGEPVGDGELGSAGVASTIAAGLAIDPVAWVHEGYHNAYDETLELWEETEEDFDFEDPQHQVSAARFPSDDPAWALEDDRPIYLVLLPVSAGWQVPAFLDYGYTNECPEPAVHVALLRRWHEQYGAELVWMFNDAIYLRALRPPADLSSARALAREQLVYCPSIEEAVTIESLAGLLHRATVWRFWWD